MRGLWRSAGGFDLACWGFDHRKPFVQDGHLAHDLQNVSMSGSRKIVEAPVETVHFPLDAIEAGIRREQGEGYKKTGNANRQQ